MDKNEFLKQIWPEWKLSDLIGYGQYGKVYRIEKESYGHVFEAALKVIEIPSDDNEIRSMQATGMDSLSIRDYFSDTAQSLKKEIDIMQDLKSSGNIVTIEDSAIIEKQDEIGWVILIRMELLDSLARYTQRRKMTTEDYVKLGMDICDAIIDCEKAGIIHRDIKPENIFVNKFDSYKLGDFGIARRLEHTKATMSKKGTELYMSPEVIKGDRYDSTVDIYSLGIMLYRFLNKGRMPFYPPFPEKITQRSVEEALQRKNRGDVFPKPCDANEELSRIILKACAYNPRDRYQRAQEMRNDLLLWMINGRKKQEETEIKRNDTEKDPEEKYSRTKSVWREDNKDQIQEKLRKIKEEKKKSQDVKEEPVQRDFWNRPIESKKEDFRNISKEEKKKSEGIKEESIQRDFWNRPIESKKEDFRNGSKEEKKKSQDIKEEPIQRDFWNRPTRKKSDFWNKPEESGPTAIRNNSKENYDQDSLKQAEIAKSYKNGGQEKVGILINAGLNNNQPDISDWKDIIAISAGYDHTVGLKNDGTVVSAGLKYYYDQWVVSQWTDIIAVSAGGDYTTGLKTDGTVVVVCSNNDDQYDVSDWTDIIAVSTGGKHLVGLKKDGTVVSEGLNYYDRSAVSHWTDIIAVSAGYDHIVGLKKDGTVVAAGSNGNGQCEVSGWKNVIAVSAGFDHTVGLKKDGTVVAAGLNYYDKLTVSHWTDIVSISAGFDHTVGLRKDGTVVATGSNIDGQCDVSGWSNIIAISAGSYYTIGLKET